MRDELEQLLHEVRIQSRRELKQARLESEAAARAEKRARFQALRSAFDAERFRWLAGHPEFALRINQRWTLDQWRSQIDLAIREENRKKA